MYGSSSEEQRAVRTFSKGLLHVLNNAAEGTPKCISNETNPLNAHCLLPQYQDFEDNLQLYAGTSLLFSENDDWQNALM